MAPRIRSKRRALAWLPVLFVPAGVLVGSGLGCELLVDVDPMLVDGSPDDVVVPATLDGYHCPICTDVSPEADFDGDDGFPAPMAKDSAPESSRDAASESSKRDARVHDAKDVDAGDAAADGR
jgi:hypothetical protein